MIESIILKCTAGHEVVISLYDGTIAFPRNALLSMLAGACLEGAFSDICPDCGLMAKDVDYITTRATTWQDVPLGNIPPPQTDTLLIITRLSHGPRASQTRFCRLTIKALGDVTNQNQN